MLIDIRTYSADHAQPYSQRTYADDQLVVVFDYVDYYAETTPDTITTAHLFPRGLGYDVFCEHDHAIGATEPAVVIPDYVDLVVCAAHFREPLGSESPVS